MSIICHWIPSAHTRSVLLIIITTCSSSRSHMSGTGKAQRSHIAQWHTSSPRAHRSQPGRWTLIAASVVFEMACLKFDGTKSQKKLVLLSLWLFVYIYFKTSFSLPSCLREPHTGSLGTIPFPCLLTHAAGKMSPSPDWTCGLLRPQALLR